MHHSYNAEDTLGAEVALREAGRYLYCVADAEEKVRLGFIGIECNEVYIIPYADICAVVHNCQAEPFQSEDPEVVKAWVLAHHKVVNAAWERWGTVLPLSFGTIIKGDSRYSAEENLGQWLKGEYAALKQKLEKVSGKAEYGVQVCWDPKVIAQNLRMTSPEIRELGDEISSKPRGLAYMYRQRLDKLIKREMETNAAQCFKDFYSRIRQYADDIRVEKTKKAEAGVQMIMNLSCLVHRDRYRELGEELDKIAQIDGFLVRFTGPWPPYSFAGSA